ncbi:BTAD domain-containing putative transcriptional regulator [Saccharothrix violaceirubra]|uniref:DNA-binding SARP family transcriptional activator n=1 Tax=Saccharothrix violaceirubra TaxID=413306 RepID=A0A7W7T2L0_9PSEU|nr:BTAD domain-containing putative transcriptional regulator [Saccharothrix violaceirubra]MBB4965455.1 DNA-binding SARP family transcriptional activator [Saccharothrix violaceirubra]
MVVELRVLGSVEAWVDGLAVDLGPARLRCLLTALVVEPDQPVTADRLVERVWADRAPRGARDTLRTYLTRLRRALAVTDEVRIGRRAGGYVLTLDPAAVDLHRFRRLTAEARTTDDGQAAADLFGRALALWRGEAFAGLDGHWISAVRTELEAERVEAELDRTDLLLRHGRHHEPLPGLVTRAAERPLDERLAGQLMLALYRCGRQAEALDGYQRIRSRLADELGADPGPRLRRLHQRILTADPTLTTTLDTPSDTAAAKSATAPPTPPRQLPAPPRMFTGRSRELGVLGAGPEADLMIATISGTGGVGKTWLALHWAHRHLDRFPDGQLYVNLRGFDPGARPVAPAVAIRGFLDALGVAAGAIPSDPDAQAALYRTLVAGKRVLVVLDNAAGAGQVAPLLPGGPPCAVLITSRNRLTSLVATHGALPVPLTMFSHDEAHELLVGHLGADRLAGEPEAAEDLLRYCAGLPLALGIVTARVATDPGMPLAVPAGELRDLSTRLDALDTGDELNARAVFSWSYRTLGPATAKLFRLMSRHPGPEMGGSAVASLAGTPAGTVRPLLAELVRAHLLTESRHGRFAFHDLLRAYAIELADRHDTEADLRRAVHRLLDHYLHTAHTADRLLEPLRDPLVLAAAVPGAVLDRITDHRRALDWFRTELPALVGAVGLAAGHRLDEHAWQLPWTLVTFLDRSGLWTDYVATQRTALDAARRRDDRDGQARAHRLLGNALGRIGRDDDARKHFGEALDLYDDTGDRVGLARTHRAICWLLGQRGRFTEALHHATCALELFQAAGHRSGEARAVNAVGWYHSLLGDHASALRLCESALALHRELGSTDGEASTLDSIGHAHHHLGDHVRAMACFEQALSLYDELGDRNGKIESLCHLGETRQAVGDLDAAARAWRQALSIMEEVGHPDADRIRAVLARTSGQAPVDDP